MRPVNATSAVANQFALGEVNAVHTNIDPMATIRIVRKAHMVYRPGFVIMLTS